ncbi:MAG: VacJ family lipoprotein [Candidatus Binatia bacterium]
MRTTSPIACVALAVVCCLSCWCSPAAAMDRQDHDPLEAMNRKIFWFNDHVDTYILVPVATGWDKITPARVKKSVSNFFANLNFPVVALNNLLQGKFLHAGSDVGRFAVNTTVGLLGFFDPASGWGLTQHEEDFGQTLGRWGLPPGPYLVLPFFGPSDPRDAVGLGVDSATLVYPFLVDIKYTVAATGVQVINARALVLKEVRDLKEASFDYYVAVRNAYQQRREALVHDRSGPAEEDQKELYTIETDGGEGE